MAVAVAKEDIDYTIKPEAAVPSISTSEWPLLLKGYDKRMHSYVSRLFISNALVNGILTGDQSSSERAISHRFLPVALL